MVPSYEALRHRRSYRLAGAFAVLVLVCSLPRMGQTRADEAPRAAPAERAAGAAKPPNVLFIAVDDLNDWVGALGGHPQARTPHIDELAARGVLFTRAYCAAPACNPSRVALMTGRRPSSTGVYHNSDPWRRALPDAVTLAQHFRSGGYSVAGAGKIYHGGFDDPPSWDEYLPRPADPVPAGRPLNGLAKTAQFDWGPIDVPDEAMGDARVVDWALAFLDRPREQAFFLAVGLYRPHLPWYVPPAYFEPFPAAGVVLPEVPRDDLDDVPEAGRRIAKPEGDHRRVTESANWRRAVSAYLASIAFADRQIGRLIAGLDARGLAKSTVIVLWGDHGWHLGEKQHWRKFALWEAATRVPFLVVAPGVTKEKQRCARTASLLDVYPTLIELCGLAKRDDLEGRSLVPLLRDPGAAWDHPVVTTHGRGNHAVRSERWRYIRYAGGGEELYDHDADPDEWKNLAGNEELASVRARLAAALPSTDAAGIPARLRRLTSPERSE